MPKESYSSMWNFSIHQNIRTQKWYSWTTKNIHLKSESLLRILLKLGTCRDNELQKYPLLRPDSQVWPRAQQRRPGSEQTWGKFQLKLVTAIGCCPLPSSQHLKGLKSPNVKDPIWRNPPRTVLMHSEPSSEIQILIVDLRSGQT